VAVNAFEGDSQAELNWVRDRALAAGAVGAAVSTHWVDGGKGSEQLAAAVVEATKQPANFSYLYDLSWSIRNKIETIATKMYGAATVSFEPKAERQLDLAETLGFGALPICMAKTPLSLSHDPALKGRPIGFTLPVKELRMLAGAGFVTAVCSGMELMPGLPSRPAGERIDLDPETGKITGLA
jgi:formate--tetrahydrofolate ligase